MKKILAFLICVTLLLAIVPAVLADGELVMDAPHSGVKVTLPAEFNNLKGLLHMTIKNEYPYGSDHYVTEWRYIGLTEEELMDLDKIIDGPDTPEEEANRLAQYEQQMIVFPFHVFAARTMGEIEDEIKQFLINEPGMTSTKIGEADGYLFYMFDSSVDFEERIKGMRPEFAEECRRVIAALREAIPKATLIKPVPKEDPYAGMPLSFETTDLDGNRVSSEELFAGNDITMLNIWATWCGPCIRELSELNEIDKRLQAKNCRVVGIVGDGNEEGIVEEAKSILAEHHVEYLNVILPKELTEFFEELPGVPTSLMVGKNGVVQLSITGAFVSVYESKIMELLGEEPAEQTKQAVTP